MGQPDVRWEVEIVSAKSVAIMASSGGLDDAYKVFNIATAAASTDAHVSIFFTFEGIMMIHKQAREQLSLGPGKEHLEAQLKTAGLPTIAELTEIASESGVRMVACQMTMDAFHITAEELVDGIEVGGAITFLEAGYNADVTLAF